MGSGVAGFTGPRDLSGKFSPLVSGVIRHYVAQGYEVAVGDAAGADSFVSFRARQAGVKPVVFAVPQAVAVEFCPLRQFSVKRVVGSRYQQQLREVGIRVEPLPVLEGGVVKVVSQVRGGRTPGNLAARSIRLVSYVSRAKPRAFVGFVSSPCPREKRRGGGEPLYPSAQSSQCFCGYGSGTWATLAYAAGLGVPVVVFCCGVSPAEALPSGWGHWVPAAVSGPLIQGWRLIR